MSMKRLIFSNIKLFKKIKKQLLFIFFKPIDKIFLKMYMYFIEKQYKTIIFKKKNKTKSVTFFKYS